MSIEVSVVIITVFGGGVIIWGVWVSNRIFKMTSKLITIESNKDVEDLKKEYVKVEDRMGKALIASETRQVQMGDMMRQEFDRLNKRQDLFFKTYIDELTSVLKNAKL